MEQDDDGCAGKGSRVAPNSPQERVLHPSVSIPEAELESPRKRQQVGQIEKIWALRSRYQYERHCRIPHCFLQLRIERRELTRRKLVPETSISGSPPVRRSAVQASKSHRQPVELCLTRTRPPLASASQPSRRKSVTPVCRRPIISGFGSGLASAPTGTRHRRARRTPPSPSRRHEASSSESSPRYCFVAFRLGMISAAQGPRSLPKSPPLLSRPWSGRAPAIWQRPRFQGFRRSRTQPRLHWPVEEAASAAQVPAA